MFVLDNIRRTTTT